MSILLGYTVEYRLPNGKIYWAAVSTEEQVERSVLKRMIEKEFDGEVIQIKDFRVEPCKHCDEQSDIESETCSNCGKPDWRPDWKPFQLEVRVEGKWEVVGRGRFGDAHEAIEVALEEYGRFGRDNIRVREYNPDDHNDEEYGSGL